MIKFFVDINNQDIYTCWGKWASLWEMTQAGFPVPEGFVLTTKAFWLSSDKREKQVVEAFDELDTQFVAVRSSWTKEDGEMDSFAGQFETFLFVTRDKLIEKIVECHNSINSNRIISYCESKNINRKEIKVAVVIQKMVNSDVAGVCFTANPVSWSRDEIMIEAGYWVGEAVVSWMITPDNYLLNKITGNIQKNISEQTRKLVLDLKNWWIQEEQVPSKEAKLQKLSDNHIQELGAYAKKIEDHYWKPMDIERAVEKEKLYILQARPITTLQQASDNLEIKVWDKIYTPHFWENPDIVFNYQWVPFFTSIYAKCFCFKKQSGQHQPIIYRYFIKIRLLNSIVREVYRKVI